MLSVKNAASLLIQQTFPKQKVADMKAEIQILSDGAFNDAYVKDCLLRIPAPPEQDKLEMLKLKLWGDAEKANGFHSASTHVSYIRSSNKEPLETAIHELIHHLMPLTILTTYGFSINEGVTEYMASKVFAFSKMTVGDRPYGPNKLLIEKLVQQGLPEDQLAAAAFDGESKDLDKALKAFAKDQCDTLILYSKYGVDAFSDLVLKLLLRD